MVEDIEKLLDRISIEHASATFSSDREFVFEQVDGSVGRDSLNMFCKEIMRKALTDAAFPAGLPEKLRISRTESRAAHWSEIFSGMLEVARDQKTSTAQVRKTASFFEFSLCLSRACLGKMIVFITKWLKNAVFRRRFGFVGRSL
jgi:hypothetical protein